MKTIRIIFSLLLITAMSMPTLSAQTKKEKKELKNLRALIYFTDGYGIYPAKMPPYETAFVFMKEDYQDIDVPPWAIKLILDTKALERERTAEHYEY